MICAGDFMLTRMRVLWLFTLTTLALTAGGFAATPQNILRLSIRLPEQVLDGSALIAEVELTNVSVRPISVQVPDEANVNFQVAMQRDFGTGKWVLHLVGGHLLAARHEERVLLAGQSVIARLAVLRDYPMGVAPGEYDISAAYNAFAEAQSSTWTGTLSSRSARMTVAAPRTAAYDEFLAVSRAAANHEAGSAGRALDFAREQPAFPYAAPLVLELASSTDAQTASEIAQFLATAYPGSEFAEQGRLIAASVLQRASDRDAYARYVRELQVYAQAPENQAVMSEARKLGTILRPEHYETAEAFVRRFPSSPMAGEALWSMIDGIEHGVYPSGHSATDRDALLARYYRQLLTLHPESFWAKQATKSESVRQLLAAQQ